MDAEAIRFVHVQRTASGRASVGIAGERGASGDPAEAKRLARELDFGRYRCTTLLARDEYQMILTEAPNVPRDELRAAIRWRVKDLLRCHPDDAMLDVLDIPTSGAGEARPVRQMFVVAAENTLVQAHVDRFSAAGIALSVIDIPETAQRNLATAAHREESAVALVHMLANGTLVTVSYRGELYFARWLDVGADQLSAAPHASDALMERIALELQRSFDHFERQYGFVGLGRLFVGPLASGDGLVEHLAQNLGVPVEAYPIVDVFGDLPEALRTRDGAARLFHLLGAALREETKVP
ncbi:MAG: agglutinin biogenesis protein MshI [Burkholderiales bacterium]|nr:agglutinin biogenesis protein MshI [Burkholderiales bacterium]